MSKKWCDLRVRIFLLMFLVAVFVLQPLRTVVMSPLIPVTWADTDSYHLFKVIHEQQEFPLDSYPKMVNSLAFDKVQANFSQFDKMRKELEGEYPEFNNYLKELQTLPMTDDTMDKIELMTKFQPILTPTEKAQLLFAFGVFAHACHVADLTFFMLEASLMGIIRHHGMIPWDDDIDVVMNGNQWRKIRDVLGNIKGFELFTPPDSQWKFYMKSASSFPDKPFKFPNLDIFFYNEDDTHIWAMTKGLKHDLVYQKSDIFPLNYRYFEGFLVPVPCNLDLVVHKGHDQNVCITPEYIHKTNEPHFYSGKTSIHCRQLYDLYPFVFLKSTSKPGCNEEHLKVGPRTIHKRILPIGCSTVSTLDLFI